MLKAPKRRSKLYLFYHEVLVLSQQKATRIKPKYSEKYYLQVTERRQFIVHDFHSVVNGAGGSLGLFLGISLLGIEGKFVNWAAEGWRKTTGIVEKNEKAKG